MRVYRSAEFERRSALYSSLDRLLYRRTRFFAAAALVNLELARVFNFFPAFPSARSFEFLSGAGAALERENMGFARQLAEHSGGSALDLTLVRAEQAVLQVYMLRHQAEYPRQWQLIRAELNALLNEHYARSLFSKWCRSGGEVGRALREVRRHVAAKLDFAMESDRVCIGLKIVEHIRRASEAA